LAGRPKTTGGGLLILLTVWPLLIWLGDKPRPQLYLDQAKYAITVFAGAKHLTSTNGLRFEPARLSHQAA